MSEAIGGVSLVAVDNHKLEIVYDNSTHLVTAISEDEIVIKSTKQDFPETEFEVNLYLLGEKTYMCRLVLEFVSNDGKEIRFNIPRAPDVLSYMIKHVFEEPDTGFQDFLLNEVNLFEITNYKSQKWFQRTLFKLSRLTKTVIKWFFIGIIVFEIFLYFGLGSQIIKEVKGKIVTPSFIQVIHEKTGMSITTWVEEKFYKKDAKIGFYQNDEFHKQTIMAHNEKSFLEKKFNIETKIRDYKNRLGVLDALIKGLKLQKVQISQEGRVFTAVKSGIFQSKKILKDNSILEFFAVDFENNREKGVIIALIPEDIKINEGITGDFKYQDQIFNIDVGSIAVNIKEGGFYGLNKTGGSNFTYLECKINGNFDIKPGTILNLKIHNGPFSTKTAEGIYVLKKWSQEIDNRARITQFNHFKEGQLILKEEILAYEKIPLSIREKLITISNQLIGYDIEKSQVLHSIKVLETQITKWNKFFTFSSDAQIQEEREVVSIFVEKPGHFKKSEKDKNGALTLFFVPRDSKQLVAGIIPRNFSLPPKGKGWIFYEKTKIKGTFKFVSFDDNQFEGLNLNRINETDSILIFTPDIDINGINGTPVSLYIEKNETNWKIIEFFRKIYRIQTNFINSL